MDFSTWLSTALGILTLTSITGVGLTWGRVKGLEARATSAEAEAVALRARVEDRDRTIIEQATAIGNCKSELAALGRVVTGEAHLVSIGHQLEDHHQAAEAHWTSIEAAVTGLSDVLAQKGKP